MPKSSSKRNKVVKPQTQGRVTEITDTESKGRNANDNHKSTVGRKRHSSDGNVAHKDCKLKKIRTRQDCSKKESDSNGHEGFDPVEFDEGDHTVEIAVRGKDENEFPRDDKDDSSDPEEEEDHTRADKSIVETSEGELSTTQSEVMDDEPEVTQTPIKKKKLKGKTNRRSVEDKIDELSSTLKAMQ